MSHRATDKVGMIGTGKGSSFAYALMQPVLMQWALGQVGEVVLPSDGQTFVADAIPSGDDEKCQRKVEELPAAIVPYRRTREQ